MLTSACLACVAQLINKKDPRQVRYLMMTLLKLKMPVQVAFLQGMLPLQHDDLFPRLLDLIAQYVSPSTRWGSRSAISARALSGAPFAR